MAISTRGRVAIGTTVWIAVAAGAVAWAARPEVNGTFARTVGAFAEDVLGDASRELLLPLADLRGVEPGTPVFPVWPQDGTTPVAHVVSLEQGGVRVRFSPGEPREGPWRLVSVPPSRTLTEALEVAVPPESAQRLKDALGARWKVTLAEALLPELERRVPAFLAHVDPTRDAASRALVDALLASVMARLDPLLDGLLADVVEAVDAKFNLLERLGLLWKLVRGDGKGLQAELQPVAREAAGTWWKAHEKEVLGAVAAGAEDQGPAFRAWLEGTAWTAARDELLVPVLAAQRARLVADGEELLRFAVAEVAETPDGHLKPRFAQVLRTHLFGRGRALLLLERGEPR